MLNSFQIRSKYKIVRPSWGVETKDENRLQLAKKTPIEKFYEGKLKRTGKVALGCCPFHEEDTPSFAIYPEQNTWHCFGCDAGGDVVSFYMKKTGCSFIKAIEDLNA